MRRGTGAAARLYAGLRKASAGGSGEASERSSAVTPTIRSEVKVNGKLCYLWRAVDHEGEVLEAVATAKRDKAAALKLLKRTIEIRAPRSIVTNGLRAYSAAMNEIGVAAKRHEVGDRLNNRAENSHQPFRRRERAMQRFRSLKTLQKFSSVHAQMRNRFNRVHLSSRGKSTSGAVTRTEFGRVQFGIPSRAQVAVTARQVGNASSRRVRSVRREVANHNPISAFAAL